MLKVNVYEDNAGGIHVIVKDGENIKNIISGCESSDDKWFQFINGVIHGFPFADKYDPDNFSGASIDEVSEEIDDVCELIAEYEEGQENLTLYKDKMGIAGRKQFGLADYEIRYHTGAGDEYLEAVTLDEAKAIADEGAAYTQRDITIHDDDGAEVARRVWYGVAYDEEDDDICDPICFGDFGYYGDWT